MPAIESPLNRCWYKCLLLAGLAIVVGFNSFVFADGPQNVLLVVNQDSADSLAVANHYIALRNIPARNVIYLKQPRVSAKDQGESIDSTAYKPDIFEPIQAAIKQRFLEDQIDCIVYSAGFPTRVICNNESKRYLKARGLKYNIAAHAPAISLTSATFYQSNLFDKNSYYLDRHSNWYGQRSKITRAFSSRQNWQQDGQPTDSEENGRRYVLSTMLAVVRPNASTRKQALAQLTRSATADGSKPNGIFYFAATSDPRSKTRVNQFSSTAIKLKDLGHQAVIGTQALPKNQRVIGATLGSARLNWPSSGSEFAPGAFCSNFTSYGGWWEKSASQTQLSHVLNHGAAGATGTVYEPYTIPSKITSSDTHVHYALGCTLAESIYQTVEQPFQLLVVGDPLCRPFATMPEFKVKGIDKDPVIDALSFSIAENGSESKIDHYELFIDGALEQASLPAGNFRIKTNELTLGHHELRIAAIDKSSAGVTATQTFDFSVADDSQDRPPRLRISRKQVPLNDEVTVACSFLEGQKVELWQNYRKLAEFQSPTRSVKIAAEKIGVGKTKLYLKTVGQKRSFIGKPVEITVVAN